MKHAPAFLKLVEEVMPRIREITPEEVAVWLCSSPHRGEAGRGAQHGKAEQVSPHPNLPPTGEGITLIDVREDSEWAAGHIEGAVHLGRGIIERDIENTAPDKNAKLVLYCGGGYRSALAADNLQKMGYENVYSLAEGWKGWTGRGLPWI